MASKSQSSSPVCGSQASKETDDEESQPFKGWLAGGETSHVGLHILDCISDSSFGHSGFSHFQTGAQSAKHQNEKDATPSSRVALSAKLSFHSAESPEKINQNLDHNMGRNRNVREPIIAWGTVDTVRKTPSNAGRQYRHPSKQRPISWSEDSSNNNKILPSTYGRSLSEVQSHDPETEAHDSETEPQECESQSSGLETVYLPRVTPQRPKHLAYFQVGEEEENEDSSPLSPLTSPFSTLQVYDFEEHPRAISDPNNTQVPKQHGPSCLQASTAFQETMVDLFGYPDYSHPPPRDSIHTIATRTKYVSAAMSKFCKSRTGCAKTEGEGSSEEQVDQLTADNAQRGWRALRAYLQDQGHSKRTSQAALSWSMLHHTVKGMGTNVEKARQDLYKRYGILPSEDANGNVVRVNTMLSQRARKTSSGARATSVRRSPDRGVVTSESGRGGVGISGKGHNPRPKQLSSSLPSKLSSPLSASLASSAKLSDELGHRGRPSRGVARGGSGRVVRPSSSVGTRTRGTGGGDGGNSGGLLPLRKISEPTFRASRSLDS